MTPNNTENETSFLGAWFDLFKKKIVLTSILWFFTILGIILGTIWKNNIITAASIFLGIIGFLYYYIKNRKKIIGDYQDIQVGGVPLDPVNAHDFPMKDSIIMLALMLAGIIALVIYAIYFVK